MNRWEYLVTPPYRVRHAIAEHFCADLPLVIDIGAYRTPLRLPYVISIDPLGTIDGAEHCTVGQWVAKHTTRPAGVVLLGADLNGPGELDAAAELVAAAKVAVIEAAVDHPLGIGQLQQLSAGRPVVCDMTFTIAAVDADGYSPFPVRRLVVTTNP